MRRARWLAAWRDGREKPVLYHCISRVVDRRFVLGVEEKEHFRWLMRVQERFTGCRVLAYCLMDNHFHLLLEVPPMVEGGLSDAELLRRLSALYGEAGRLAVDKELCEARRAGVEGRVAEIHARYSYRMHSLSEFMKGLLQRYTRWHNRRHERTGRLWEDRFKSVIVEDGAAARAITAYIDLNPVRAGMVADPAEYRWSSYGEAVGASAGGGGGTARAGLVRAMRAHQGVAADAGLWRGDVSREYRRLLMAAAGATLVADAVAVEGTSQSGPDPDLPFSRALRCRIRYFSDGAVIGSRTFVDEAFRSARWRFGVNRRNGARRLRGSASAMAGTLWTGRDLQKGIGADMDARAVEASG